MSLQKLMLTVRLWERKRNKVHVHIAQVSHTSFLLLFSTLARASCQKTLLSEKMEGHPFLMGRQIMLLV